LTPEEEIKRANRAAQILEDEVFSGAIKQVEDALLSGMRSAAIVDDKLRLRLLDKYESVQAILACLKSTMETGKLAKAQLELNEKKNLLQRVRDIYG